jgi:hypothetical protein
MISTTIKMAIRDFAERSGNTQMTYTQIKALIVLLKGIEDAVLWEKMHVIYPNIHNSTLESPNKFRL